MKNIVTVEQNELMVSIADVAKFSGNNEKSIKRLLTDNEDKFEELGLKVKESKSILNRLAELKLNQEQTTFLMLLMRNNPQVVEFKFNLTMQYHSMKHKLETLHTKELQQKETQLKLSQEETKKAREKSRLYAKTRKGNAQSIVNIIREYTIQISSHELNNMLYEVGMLKRVPKDGYHYFAPDMSNGTPLVNVDIVLALLDSKGYVRGVGYADMHPQFDFEEERSNGDR